MSEPQKPPPPPPSGLNVTRADTLTIFTDTIIRSVKGLSTINDSLNLIDFIQTFVDIPNYFLECDDALVLDESLKFEVGEFFNFEFEDALNFEESVETNFWFEANVFVFGVLFINVDSTPKIGHWDLEQFAVKFVAPTSTSEKINELRRKRGRGEVLEPIEI